MRLLAQEGPPTMLTLLQLLEVEGGVGRDGFFGQQENIGSRSTGSYKPLLSIKTSERVAKDEDPAGERQSQTGRGNATFMGLANQMSSY